MQANINDDTPSKLAGRMAPPVVKINSFQMLGQEIVKTGADFERMKARLVSYDPPLIDSTNSHAPIDAPMTGDARPWLPIDSEYAAGLFAGQRVEVDAPATESYTAHALHGQTVKLCSYAPGGGLVFGHSSAISWMGRHNVRLRPAVDTVSE